jgi:O-antigen ligase
LSAWVAAARPPIAWAAALLAGLLFVAVGFIAGAEPRYGIVMALSLAYAVVVIVDLSMSLNLFVVAVFSDETPLAGTLVSVTKIVGLLLALGWLVRIATQTGDRRTTIFAEHPIASYLLVLLVGWVGLSILWAQDTGLAVERASVVLLAAILYVIIYTAIRTRRDAIWLLGAFILGTAFTAAYGLVLRPESDQSAERLASTIADPNFLAAILVAGLALGGSALIAARRHRLLQLGALITIALCLGAFVLTGSRGGIVGLAAALIAAIAFGGRWRLQIVLAATAIATLAVGYYATLAPHTLLDRFSTATTGEVSLRDSRVTIWTVAWRMSLDHPVTGVGIGNFPTRSAEYSIEPGATYRTDRTIDQPAVAHNSYLGPLAETGFVGFGLFISILLFSIGCGVRAVRRFARDGDRAMEALGRGLVIALIGTLTSAFFISAESDKFIWLMLAMGPALLGVAERSEPIRSSRREGRQRSLPNPAAVRPPARLS